MRNVKWRVLQQFLRGWLKVERGAETVREWAMEKAIQAAPDFETFTEFLQTYFEARGLKIQVTMHGPETEITGIPNTGTAEAVTLH